MTDLDRFSSFRAHVARPSTFARESARRRLLAADTRPARRRRLTAALAGAAVAAAAAVAAVALGDGAPSVVERAEAAIDPRGRVLHVVVRIVGADGTETSGESWIRPDGTGRTLTPSEAPAGDCLGSETEMRCYDRERNVIDVYRYNPEAVEAGRRFAGLPGFRVDRPESIRGAFDAGYARLLGETELDGRPVYEFELATPFIGADGKATPQFGPSSPILYLDRETYYPVAQEFPDARSVTYYETYEYLPFDARTRALLELDAKPGARVVEHPVGEGPQG